MVLEEPTNFSGDLDQGFLNILAIFSKTSDEISEFLFDFLKCICIPFFLVALHVNKYAE